jgi:hypothetical protein
MHRLVLLALVVSAIAATGLITSSASSGATPGSAVRVTLRDVGNVTNTGEVFLRKSFTINYTGGTVTVAGDPSGTTQINVDDQLRIVIIHQDGTRSVYSHDFSSNCIGVPDTAIDPVDLTSRLKSGVNTIKFAYQDKCGGLWGTEETWLTLP